jgi:hypothetical protein
VRTRQILIIILAAILLAAYYSIGTGYLKQRHEYVALASQITGATGKLAEIPPPPADLDQRLADAQANLDAVKNSLPGQMNSTAMVNSILEIAEGVGVKAIPLVTQPWTTQSIGDHDYSVFRFGVSATGTFTQLANFLKQLETGELDTLVIENLSLYRIPEPAGAGNEIPVKADLEIAVYARPFTTTQPGKVND